MSFIDARTLPDGHRVTADICIVGAGAAADGQESITELLIAGGADINSRAVINLRTPLFETIRGQYESIVKLLISNGADVDATDYNGYTPMRRAVNEGQLAMAKLLIEKVADIATRDKYDITPLHVVAQTDRIAIAEYLIAKSADINTKDNNSGFTPFDYAQDGNEGMIEMLERHGGK